MGMGERREEGEKQNQSGICFFFISTVKKEGGSESKLLFLKL